MVPSRSTPMAPGDGKRVSSFLLITCLVSAVLYFLTSGTVRYVLDKLFHRGMP